MILAVRTRLCWKLSCLNLSKFIRAAYSANAQVKPKQFPSPQILKEPPCIVISEKCQRQQIIIDPKHLIPPDIICNEAIAETLKEIKNVDNENLVVSAKKKWIGFEVDPSKLHKYCLMLSKARLTSLVVMTAMGGYAIAPGVFDLYTFLACSVGTGLVSASANAVNQSLEVPFDAQMARTKNRVLVRGLLTPSHALLFAAISGVAGISILAFEVNTLAALLGGANLILYTLIYTPMKRISIVNTWIGSVVGAIPPLMGWAGCVNSIASPGAWIMPGILYAWQFPHFNALSWNLRPDYSKAGYRMMAISNPDLCRRTAMRYTGALMVLSYLAPILDVTNWWFAVASTPLNAYFLYLAWQFRKEGDAATSRRLFRFSLIHLPLLMTLMLLSKKYWYTNEKKEISQVTEKNTKLFELIKRIFQTSAA